MSLFPHPSGTVLGSPTVTPEGISDFGTHFSHLGIGGWVEMPTLAEMNSIPTKAVLNQDKASSGRRRVSMACIVFDDPVETNNGIYTLNITGFLAMSDSQRLAALKDNTNWKPLKVGGAEAPYTLNVTEQYGSIQRGIQTNTSQGYLSKILVKYQSPQFSSFTFQGLGSRTLERGVTFQGGVFNFAWATSNNANVKPNSIVLKDLTLNTNLAVNLFNDGQESISISTFTVPQGAPKVFQIQGQDTENNYFSANLSIAGLPAMYFGASTLTQAEMQGAIQNGGAITNDRLASLSFSKLLQDGKILNQNYTCTGGRYIHILWDEQYGAAPGAATSWLCDLG